MWLLPLIIVGYFSARPTKGSVFTGFLVGKEFEYVGKYCFDYNANFSAPIGSISGEIRTETPDVQVALYDDETQFWDFIMKEQDDCDCFCKTQLHSKQLFNVTPMVDPSSPSFRFESTLHEHLRPRFWYVALARCVPNGDAFIPSLYDLTAEDFAKYFFNSFTIGLKLKRELCHLWK